MHKNDGAAEARRQTNQVPHQWRHLVGEVLGPAVQKLERVEDD